MIHLKLSCGILSGLILTALHCLAQPRGISTPASAQVRTNLVAINDILNNRYSGVASSSTAYDKALDRVVQIRSKEDRAADGTLSPEWVKKLAQAYSAVGEACKVCAEEADAIDPQNWSKTFDEKTARLRTSQAKDQLEGSSAIRKKTALLQVPAQSLTIEQKSELNTLDVIIENTAMRVKIYEEALSIFDRIDAVVAKNDKILSSYRKVFLDMKRSYDEFSETLYAIFELQRLRELEVRINKIVEQPQALLQEANAIRNEWRSIQGDMQKVVDNGSL